MYIDCERVAGKLLFYELNIFKCWLPVDGIDWVGLKLYFGVAAVGLKNGVGDCVQA